MRPLRNAVIPMDPFGKTTLAPSVMTEDLQGPPPQLRTLLSSTEQYACFAINLDERPFVLVNDGYAEVDDSYRIRRNRRVEIIFQRRKLPLRVVDQLYQGNRTKVCYRDLLEKAPDALKSIPSAVPGNYAHVVVVERGLRFLGQCCGQGYDADRCLCAFDTAEKLLTDDEAAREPDGGDAAKGLNPSRPVDPATNNFHWDTHGRDVATILARAA